MKFESRRVHECQIEKKRAPKMYAGSRSRATGAYCSSSFRPHVVDVPTVMFDDCMYIAKTFMLMEDSFFE